MIITTKMQKNRTLTAISLVLMLAITTVTLLAMPVIAQDEYENMQDGYGIPLPPGVTPDITFDTVSHLAFRPNPVGKGQPFLVNGWVSPNLGGTQIYTGYTVTITKPDATSDVVVCNPRGSDSTFWFEYIADQEGTWTLEFDFAGSYFPPGNYSSQIGTVRGQYTIVEIPESSYYNASSDGPYELVVQTEWVESWPPSPLPTDYWTRPVSPENREWWEILGYYPAAGVVGGGPNWPDDTNTYMSNYKYTPYVQAPNTAHILWKRQGAIGGLTGGVLGYSTSGAGGGTPTLIYAGRCYQTVTKMVDGTPTDVWQCYDLRTGEVYWEQTGVPIPQYITYEAGWLGGEAGVMASTGSSSGIFPTYIGGGREIKYDPYTGEVASIGRTTWNISIAPLTSGELYAHYEHPYYLTVQNIGTPANPNYRLINFTVFGWWRDTMSIVDVELQVAGNVSWPFSGVGGRSTVNDYETGVAVGTERIYHPATGEVSIETNLIAADLKTGAVLWNHTADLGWADFVGLSTGIADHGKFAMRFKDGHHHCWDLLTGQHLWESEMTSWPWGWFGCYGQASYGGNIIYNLYDGVVAWDWDTGKLSWWYKAPAPYPYETPYQSIGEEPLYPFFTGTWTIADGKIYTYNTEHSVTQPVTRGWKLHCIDAATGKGIWNITGSMAPGAVADGYLTASNGYDGYMYVFGRGPTTATVTASSKTIAKGDTVLIEGTVLDQSPGQPGTPCVSEESMATYMEYLHMQKPIPEDCMITGVPVMLHAVDLEGNAIVIGTVTSDLGGFRHEWTPPDEGLYTITAVFDGDESYGSSWAATGLSVGPEAEPYPEFPEYGTTGFPAYPEPAEAYTTIDLAIIVAVAVAIIIGIINLWALRKRT